MTDLELNNLVAEKVLGIKSTVSPEGSVVVDEVGVPAYSTDIVAAMGVVDQMVSLGKNFVISNSDVGSVKSPGVGFWCAFGFDRDKINVVRGETIAKVICLAALKGVEK